MLKTMMMNCKLCIMDVKCG